ncbi:tetratricopeptide repeat protein [Kitasatospora purpeofusca]|uniref:tetratricopeptide repeat protein n=1 Tax=Kitasatospora purpeofusca TaxID=67352 RepID=UPI003811490B
MVAEVGSAPGGTEVDSHQWLLRSNQDTRSAACHSARTFERARSGLQPVLHWQHLTADTERLLGDDHPDTLTSRNNLATSYQQAGRTPEAIVLQERVLTDRESILGPDHPDTLVSVATSPRPTGKRDAPPRRSCSKNGSSPTARGSSATTTQTP